MPIANAITKPSFELLLFCKKKGGWGELGVDSDAAGAAPVDKE